MSSSGNKPISNPTKSDAEFNDPGVDTLRVVRQMITDIVNEVVLWDGTLPGG